MKREERLGLVVDCEAFPGLQRLLETSVDLLAQVIVLNVSEKRMHLQLLVAILWLEGQTRRSSSSGAVAFHSGASSCLRWRGSQRGSSSGRCDWFDGGTIVGCHTWPRLRSERLTRRKLRDGRIHRGRCRPPVDRRDWLLDRRLATKTLLLGFDDDVRPRFLADIVVFLVSDRQAFEGRQVSLLEPFPSEKIFLARRRAVETNGRALRQRLPQLLAPWQPIESWIKVIWRVCGRPTSVSLGIVPRHSIPLTFRTMTWRHILDFWVQLFLRHRSRP